jgi:FkbM family methyltransferase
MEENKFLDYTLENVINKFASLFFNELYPTENLLKYTIIIKYIIIMSFPRSTSSGEIGKILHIILNNVLLYKTDGLFIEIGANDGKTGSFTYNLGEIGWYGINFEPIPRLYNLCCHNHKNHKNVKNYNLALGEKEGQVDIIDADTLSTIDTDVIDTYLKTPQFKSYFINNNNYHKVKMNTLDNILKENYITNIDILVLDVEGYEENVLKGFSIENYNPVVFIIEIADQHSDFINNDIMMKKYKNLREYLKINNYTLLVNDVVDNVYIHNNTYNTLDTNFIAEIKQMVKFPQFT